MAYLHDIQFIDIYMWPTMAEVSGTGTEDDPRPLGEEFETEWRRLRSICEERYQKLRLEEFVVLFSSGPGFQDEQFRVTVIREATDDLLYVGRRSRIINVELPSLGFHREIVEEVLDPTNSGLVLVVGPMKGGKTVTLAAIGQARAAELGGLGVAIEDPPETYLSGRFGHGRWVQTWAHQRNGGYKELIKKSLRSGANMCLVGEIRDPETATEVALAGCNGHFMLSSAHASSCVEGIKKLVGWVETHVGTTRGGEYLASSLSTVIWQQVEHLKPGGVRMNYSALIVRDRQAVQAQIRDGRWSELNDALRSQTERRTWHSK